MANENTALPQVDYLVSALAGARRRSRQESAHLIAQVAHQDVEQLMPYVDELVDALYRPEAQTRWEIFDALGEVAARDITVVEGAFEPAEASLFDESSATVRLAAFKFLCRLGASDPAHADQVWPILDESVQCYHGDPEYHDMLLALLELAHGDLSDATRTALVTRVGFDADNGTGFNKSCSAQIIAAAQGKA